MKKIFLVEDHPVIRDTYSMFIDRNPDLHVSHTAESAEAALDKLESANPDLLLIDISLPGRSGIELIAILRAKGVHTPVLVLSGHDTAEYRESARRAGANDFVTKKDGPRLLIDAIRNVLENGNAAGA